MSATPKTPRSPWNLESGNKFTFEPSLRSHHYLVHLFKMMKCPLLLSLVSLVMLAVMLITAQGAPLHSAPLHRGPLHSAGADMTARSGEELDVAGIPEPPMGRAARNVSPSPPSFLATISPLVLPFIKNPHCSLHTSSNTTVSKMCGLRQLDLPEGASGIKSWNPNLCKRFHCKCLATKEVHRMKRTIADNKTTVDTHRYRVFECV